MPDRWKLNFVYTDLMALGNQLILIIAIIIEWEWWVLSTSSISVSLLLHWISAFVLWSNLNFTRDPFVLTYLLWIAAFVRTIEACGKLKHYDSWTQIQNPKSYMYKDRAGVVTIFRCAGEKSPTGTTPVKLQQLENVILGREGVMYVLHFFLLQLEHFDLGTLLMYGTM